MARTIDTQAAEMATYWRHPSFPDLRLLKARFTQHRYELHTHETYVIALITAGAERIRIGRRNVLAPAGTIAVVNPEEWHDGERGTDEGWAYRTLYPSVALMMAVASELGRDCAPAFACTPIADQGLAAELLAAHASSTLDDEIAAETSLLVALRRLILRHAERGARPEEIEPAGAGGRFALYETLIARDLGEKLDLQRLAKAADVTRFQVIRDFKKVIGATPSTYIRDRRLRRARLLIEEGLPLATAAQAAGFADQSHLSRAFRAAHGITPGTFRRAS